MDRDDDGERTRGDWDDVRDEDRGMGYSAAPDVETQTIEQRLRARRRSCPPRGYHRSDERIRDDVYDLLCGPTGADASDVTVVVNDGEVTLSGTVPEREDERRIVAVAGRVLGVRSVVSHVRVTAPAPA